MDLYHKTNFLEFCRLELLSGGPDPHLAVTGYAVKQLSNNADKAWRVGCYIGPYEATTGAVIYHYWPLKRVLADEAGFRSWVKENWSRILFRRERRAARSIPKFTDSLLSYAQWVDRDLPTVRGDGYAATWESAIKGIRYVGRYATIKLLEGLTRYAGVDSVATDIRPAGAWSPRKTLAMVFPEHAALLNSNDNKPATLTLANDLASSLRSAVSAHAKQLVTNFQVEVLLCNYRQALAGKYPGRPQDTDLSYHYEARQRWGDTVVNTAIDFFTARQSLFNGRVLGEKIGWHGVREELGLTHPKYGYFWSDVIYDYKKTHDLAAPVRYETIPHNG